MAAALFLFFAIASCVWLHLNRAPPNWDDAWYLSNSLALYDSWSAGGLIGLARHFLASLGFKAPLVIALPLPFYWIFGRRWHIAFLVNIASMLVVFVAVWRVGKRLQSQRAGLMAIYIAGTLPLLYGLSRWYMVEYPMAALLAVTFWLALAASASPNIAHVIGLGVALGAGLLLKADFPLFALPMLGYVIWQRVAWHRRDRLEFVLAVILPAIVLAGPWYLYHWRATFENAIAAGYGLPAIVQGTGDIFSFRAVWGYIQLVVERGVSPYYAILSVAALIAIAAQRRFDVFRRTAPLLLWLAPFPIFLFGGNKDVRYIAPLLPAFALGLACFIDTATKDWKWTGLIALVFPLVSFLAVSFGWPYHAQDLGYAIRYDSNSWEQEEILDVITGDVTYRYGEKKTILLGTDRGRFNADNFTLAITQRQLPFQVETTAYANSMSEVLQQANGASYLVYKEGGEPESAYFNTHFASIPEQLKRSPGWQEISFPRAVPDGGIVHILRHR